MRNKAAFPSQFIQGQGVLNELPELIKLFGNKGLILASKSVKEKIIPAFGKGFIESQIPVELFNGECCEDELKRLDIIIKRDKVDVFVGMGGGKTIISPSGSAS